VAVSLHQERAFYDASYSSPFPVSYVGCPDVTEGSVLEEYVRGGMGRWVWFLPLLVDICPPKVAQVGNNRRLLHHHACTVTSCRCSQFYLISTLLCALRLLQFFHDQVIEFAKDHGITAANVPMCRP
jgi:hypothetical protein